ncbi:MAG: T9SS type A sorting domain-containing protein, partial [Ignavibacterium sp.]|nr:T9SS type A sorting domain-containing protein [Ignavibacterium sp.]
YQSKIFIEQKIPTDKCISLNYPYTLHNSFVDSAASLFYENGRTLGQVPNDSSLTQEHWFGLKAKVVSFNQPRNSTADDLDELYSFLEWTQNSINNRKWGMIIIHDVVPFTQLPELVGQGIYEPISNEWLTSLCDYLWARSSNKEVWVETVGNITRYIKERDDAEYQIISSSNQLIEITLTDNLNDEIFNYPLSAYIKVPGDWNYVRLQQGNFVDTLEVIEKDTDWVVLAKITPDKGLIRLTPVTPTPVEDEIQLVDKFELFQNYPNPFNPSTIIKFTIPNVTLSEVEGARVQLKVYDVLGNEVATLVDEYKPAGMYNVQFIMQNEQRSSGLYFYQLKVGDYSEAKKMMYLK